ncbi:terpene synthase metal binding domain-containing protein [Hirsutella rhossiliensis]|uniref:Terpene synthase n=1 Tax=Hirsutella rhossiliensis TaxID=111463 RepID=A0A9P8MXQ7_9HYPO|nr:terpene synthase metal binding domain-containing protein [Hirsutella rhossiliensis]KAH0962216.1 terpene synthase metal binding domain-containing protein [Hirsutella rhossiliensis]
MFKSFLGDITPLNPHWERVKLDSENYIIKFCQLSQRAAEKVRQCDFTYCCAIVYPHAPLDKFRTVSDWGNWVFPFDDRFDEGELGTDVQGARLEMDSLMSHLTESMEHYRHGVLTQVGRAARGDTPNKLEEMLRTRTQSIAGWPMYVLVEYAHGLNIPSDVFEHEVIKDLQQLAFDMIAICNDIISYRKEEMDAMPHNMVARCRINGLSAQQAFEMVGTMLDGRIARWDESLSRLPSWGSQVDPQVEEYIEAIRNLVRANLRYSFRGERYFGKEAAEVQKTRQLVVCAYPPYQNV